MSKIGYYRFKTTVEDGKTVTLYKNEIESGTHTIKSLEYCSGFLILKYLDSKGQYRFFSFNKYYEINDRPNKIGQTNEFITNILTDQSNSKNIGYRNERQRIVSAEVDEERLNILSDIYTSPRVYLYVGSGISDTLSDWILLTDVSGDNVVKRRKQKTGLITLTLTLPEWFTVKMV